MRTLKKAKVKLYSRNTDQGFQENCQEGNTNVSTEGINKPLISFKLLTNTKKYIDYIKCTQDAIQKVKE